MPDVIILKEMQGFCDTTRILYKWSIYVPLEIILLRTSYIGTGSSSNIILTCNLVLLGVYMVKICHEKMLTLEMYPSKIN